MNSYEFALKLIARGRCERIFVGNCWTRKEWRKNAKYTADRWCGRCIAKDALRAPTT